jgi:hypothetical protein
MSRPHAPEEMNDRHIGTRLGQIGTKTARNMGTETNRPKFANSYHRQLVPMQTKFNNIN